jgi:hypothetical protein
MHTFENVSDSQSAELVSGEQQQQQQPQHNFSASTGSARLSPVLHLMSLLIDNTTCQ